MLTAVGMTLLFHRPPAVFAQHGDVWLHIAPVGGKLAVGVADEEATTYTSGVRVFEAILTPDDLPFSSFDYSAEDPGFRSAPGDLPASQSINLAVQSLQLWNGSGLAPAAGVAFNFDLSGGLASDATGGIHAHPLYGLSDLTLDPLPLPDGVYVASIRASTAGLATSDLFYFVMLKDDLIANEDDTGAVEALLEGFENGGPAPVLKGKDFRFFEEAAEFVAASIPEPGSVGLLVFGLLGLAATRRGRLRACQRSIAVEEERR